MAKTTAKTTETAEAAVISETDAATETTETATATKTTKTAAAAKFPKEKFLTSKAYKEKFDLLNAILEDGETYTKSEVEKLVENYLKKEV